MGLAKLKKLIPKKMESEKIHHHTFIVHWFSLFIEWGNRWLTLSHWLFKGGEYIFVKVETLMLFLTAFCFTLPFWVEQIPNEFQFLFYIFVVQRIVEFLIVYSRNFIFKRGRIYAQVHSDLNRGVWLILMFSLSVMQIVLVFAAWFRLISFHDLAAFSRPLDGLNSIYFSVVSFLTIGYGDITPLKVLPKILMIFHGFLTYFVVVIVINGLIFAQYGSHPLVSGKDAEEPK